MVDIPELQRITSEAKRANLARNERLRQEAENRKEETRLIEEAKVLRIILQIPERARTEARQGRTHAIVMSVIAVIDYERPAYELKIDDWRTECKPEWLIGPAKMVYDYCKAQGLKPTLEYWTAYGALSSGFNIVIHWM